MDAILEALENLLEQDFRTFCFALTNLKEGPPVRVSDVEGKSRVEITQLLRSRFGSGAVDRTIETLRDIGCNNQAEELEKKKEADRPQPKRPRSRTPPPEFSSGAGPSGVPSGQPSSAPRADPKELLRSVRRQFVESVSGAVLDQLLDRLLEKKVVTSEEMESASVKPRADKARYVVDSVIMKGSRAASVLIEDYCKLDPLSDLCQELRTKF